MFCLVTFATTRRKVFLLESEDCIILGVNLGLGFGVRHTCTSFSFFLP